MRVRVLPYQPHCFAFGGFEVQMLDALYAAQRVGIDIRPLDVWSRDADFDILHAWGLSEIHLQAVIWAKKSGKKIIVTALLPYTNPRVRLRHRINNFVGRNQSVLKVVSLLDALVVVNEAQAEAATTLYGIPQNKIFVVPNIVSDGFYSPKGEDKEIFGLTRYLICVGSISARKNQLKLVRAAISAKTPLLLIGQALAGEDAYEKLLRMEIATNDSIRWIEQGLPVGSAELIAAYQGSVGFALPSHNETQPISALEAAVLGKPLLLSDMPWAKQKFYKDAYLVNPNVARSICDGIKRMVDSQDEKKNISELLMQCNSLNVGHAYAGVYKQIM